MVNGGAERLTDSGQRLAPARAHATVFATSVHASSACSMATRCAMTWTASPLIGFPCLVWGTWENKAMARQRGELVPIGEVVSGLDDVPAIRDGSPRRGRASPWPIR